MDAIVNRAADVFRRKYGTGGELHLGWSPGRINLIGEYTDLNMGLVLPMAIDLGIAAVMRLRDDGRVSACSTTFDEAAECTLVGPETGEQPKWARYVAGVARLCREAGCPLSGFELAIHANLPANGGVSSSAALTTALCMAIQSATGWSQTPITTARLCQRVEHRFAGVRCGLMDQLACRLGEAGGAVFIDCASLDTEIVPWNDEIVPIVVDSGVSRSLHATAYNRRREECRMAVAAFNARGLSIESLREADLAALETLRPSLDAAIYRRCRHVLTENARVLDARRALRRNDLAEFGALMYRSHASLRDDFAVSVAELDHIVDTAGAGDGAIGARLTGAGFGGNAIVLTRDSAVAEVERHLKSRFAKRFGREPSMFSVGTTNPARGHPL